jgi:hypothetical protein
MAHQKPEYLAKHPGGRPSAYKPEYCEQVVEYMAKGKSLTAFAGSIRQGKQTIYDWVGQFPEFAEAVERARAARIVPWEDKLMTADKGAQAACTIFALKNCDPLEWREVRYASFEHDVNINTLSDDQLAAIALGRRAPEVGAIDVQYNRLMERPQRYLEPKKPGTRGPRNR